MICHDSGASEYSTGERHIERIVLKRAQQLLACFVGCFGPRPLGEIAQHRKAALADHAVGDLGDHAEHAGDAIRIVVHGDYRKRCGRSPPDNRCARETTAAPHPRWRGLRPSTCSMRGPISGQISSQTLSARAPSTQSRLIPTVGRYASLQKKVNCGPPQHPHRVARIEHHPYDGLERLRPSRRPPPAVFATNRAPACARPSPRRR